MDTGGYVLEEQSNIIHFLSHCNLSSGPVNENGNPIQPPPPFPTQPKQRKIHLLYNRLKYYSCENFRVHGIYCFCSVTQLYVVFTRLEHVFSVICVYFNTRLPTSNSYRICISVLFMLLHSK